MVREACSFLIVANCNRNSFNQSCYFSYVFIFSSLFFVRRGTHGVFVSLSPFPVQWFYVLVRTGASPDCVQIIEPVHSMLHQTWKWLHLTLAIHDYIVAQSVLTSAYSAWNKQVSSARRHLHSKSTTNHWQKEVRENRKHPPLSRAKLRYNLRLTVNKPSCDFCVTQNYYCLDEWRWCPSCKPTLRFWLPVGLFRPLWGPLLFLPTCSSKSSEIESSNAQIFSIEISFDSMSVFIDYGHENEDVIYRVKGRSWCQWIYFDSLF